MAASLESRIPLLDRRVVEFVWSLPASLRWSRGGGKRLLREVLYRHVPRALVDRPKMGFGVPIDAWLRGPLREWGEALLGEHRLTHEGLLAPREIRRRWREHLRGERDWRYPLWDVLMFQAWLERERAPAG
jgi:asparagine synthase (glutamine-hydrolysing)